MRKSTRNGGRGGGAGAQRLTATNAERRLCGRCQRPVDLEGDRFVVPNREVDVPENWRYLHLDCFQCEMTEGFRSSD